MRARKSQQFLITGTVVAVLAIVAGFFEKIREQLMLPGWVTAALAGFLALLGALSFVMPRLQKQSEQRSMLEAYREAMRSHAEYLSSKPFPSVFILPLCEEVRDQLQPSHTTTKPPADDIEEALSESRHIVIEGEAGTGKSTVLNSIVLGHISVKHNGEPIKISAKGLAEMKTNLAASLLGAVTKELGQLPKHRLPDNFFEVGPPGGSWMNFLGFGQPRSSWTVLVDGLDEIDNRGDRETLMLGLKRHLEDPDYRFIVTTRPLGDDPEWFDRFARYRLLPFRPEQIKEWARKRVASRANANPDGVERFLALLAQHTEALQVPILLAMAADLFEADHINQLPTLRATLYGKYTEFRLNTDDRQGEAREFVRGQWDRRYGAQERQWVDAIFNERRKLLEHLADWEQNGGAGVLADQAAHWLAREFVSNNVDRVWLREWAETLLLGSGLLIRSAGKITFAHYTFREYLAASAVANHFQPDVDTARALVARWQVAEWREVVLFALGIWSEKGIDLTAVLSEIDLASREGLRFAGAALADGVRLDRLEDAIIDGLLKAKALDVLSVLYRRERVTNGLRVLARDHTQGPFERALAAEALGRLARAEGAKTTLEEARTILLDISQEPGGDPGDVLQPLDAICRLGSDEAVILFTELARRGDYYLQAVDYLSRLERFEKVVELIHDPAIRLKTRMRAVSVVSNMKISEAVPILRDLLRNAEQFSLGPKERIEVEKALQTLRSNTARFQFARIARRWR